MIAIIDYDMGNVGSIYNILKRIGAEDVAVTNDYRVLSNSDRFILPGVGAFDTGMNNLKKYQLDAILEEQVIEKKKPILGICLGMQLLGRKSEEGTEQGLGWIPFDNVKFDLDETYKVPHMGWDYISCNGESKLTKNFSVSDMRFYFVHSYYAKCDNRENVIMECDYGYTFAAAVGRDNVYGVQFHPEKSHKYGMKLMNNFMES